MEISENAKNSLEGAFYDFLRMAAESEDTVYLKRPHLAVRAYKHKKGKYGRSYLSFYNLNNAMKRHKIVCGYTLYFDGDPVQLVKEGLKKSGIPLRSFLQKMYGFAENPELKKYLKNIFPQTVVEQQFNNAEYHFSPFVHTNPQNLAKSLTVEKLVKAINAGQIEKVECSRQKNNDTPVEYEISLTTCGEFLWKTRNDKWKLIHDEESPSKNLKIVLCTRTGLFTEDKDEYTLTIYPKYFCPDRNKETYLAKWVTEDGEMVYFERWGCKRTSTVLKNMKKLWNMTSYRNNLEKDGCKGTIQIFKPVASGVSYDLLLTASVND